ncbi:hypothetical protein OBV_24930 [Oscillibacter valericigenes Sjm18-20]|nr:hypothetical protein OBV_24930 [Oscillibacter valericigenes Sjm18-20]
MAKVERITEVAKFFLQKEKMTHKKLQKICYYAQAWFLANHGEPLTPDHFEAWVHGPVSPVLYAKYREWGWEPISIPEDNQPYFENPRIADYLELVYKTYGKYSGDELETFTHNEEPWKKARNGYSPSDYCRNTISTVSMKDYYKKRLTPKGDKK